jgi:curved DNA-binding protein CbpA
VRPSLDGHPWHVLGLPPGSDAAEIKRAYRRLARTVHPDLHPGASADERRVLEARFHELTEAYRTLVA